jgi:hypothetical protein
VVLIEISILCSPDPLRVQWDWNEGDGPQWPGLALQLGLQASSHDPSAVAALKPFHDAEAARRASGPASASARKLPGPPSAVRPSAPQMRRKMMTSFSVKPSLSQHCLADTVQRCSTRQVGERYSHSRAPSAVC